MVVKFRMLLSVNVLYVRIDHKLISVLITNKRRERGDWEESSKIPRIKKLPIATVRERVIIVVLHYT